METELYPGHTEEQRKREELKARIERAHATVLPGALRLAFAGNDCVTATAGEKEYKLQPVTLGMTANLERIKSPLLDMVRIMREVFSDQSRDREGAGNPLAQRDGSVDDLLKKVTKRVAALKFEEEQIAETVFIFINPPKKVRQLLEGGPRAFREAAMDELGDKLHPAQMAALQRACSQHYVASFATIIGYGVQPPEGNGEGHAVSFRPPSPSGATGSVGG